MKMMKNKLGIGTYLLLGILLVLAGVLFFVQRQKNADSIKQNEISQELASIEETIDQGLLNDDLTEQVDRAIKEDSPNDVKEIDNLLNQIESGALGATHEEYLKKISSAPANSFYQLSLIESLYKSSKAEYLLPSLFTLSVTLRDFDNALEYLQILEKSDSGFSDVGIKTYLFALFNAVDLDFSVFNRLKHIVNTYHDEGYLSTNDKDFYYSLITLSRGDLANYDAFMKRLEGSSYASIAKKYNAALVRSDSFVDTPDYYLQALISVGLFQEGWYRIVQHIARSIIRQDASYILAHQLDAYSSLMLEDRAQAFESLEYLKKNDKPNKELYVFLGGISAYYLERYEEAILNLNQLVEQKDSLDVQRYRLLAYGKSGDIRGYAHTLRKLLRHDTLFVHDYFSLFQELFFSNNGTSLKYIDILTTDIDLLLKKCYEDMNNELAYICLYGKAGLYAVMEDHERVYQYLTRIVEWYPHKDVFMLLGKTALLLDLKQESVRRYIKSLGSSQDENEYLAVKTLVKDIMMNR